MMMVELVIVLELEMEFVIVKLILRDHHAINVKLGNLQIYVILNARIAIQLEEIIFVIEMETDLVLVNLDLKDQTVVLALLVFLEILANHVHATREHAMELEVEMDFVHVTMDMLELLVINVLKILLLILAMFHVFSHVIL